MGSWRLEIRRVCVPYTTGAERLTILNHPWRQERQAKTTPSWSDRETSRAEARRGEVRCACVCDTEVHIRLHILYLHLHTCPAGGYLCRYLRPSHLHRPAFVSGVHLLCRLAVRYVAAPAHRTRAAEILRFVFLPMGQTQFRAACLLHLIAHVCCFRHPHFKEKSLLL